jgi:alpha-L-arabinofuranosidase
MPARVDVLLNEPLGTISPFLYGHFAEHLGCCVNEGLWVGPDSPIPNTDGLRSDVLAALQRLSIPVLRWPGGCFADDYHWEHGVGPREHRPRTVNIWWGESIEDNAFGTHEFLHLCKLLGARPYLAGNVGSGSPREMRDWVEYCNFAGDSTLARRRAANGSPQPFNVTHWGVGNENWGCGGNFCPESYANEYKRFETYLRDFSGHKLFLVACGPDGNDENWTRRFFNKLAGFPRIHGFAAHYYTMNRDGRFGTATDFNPAQWYALLHKATGVDALIRSQRQLLDELRPHNKVELIIDEWGAWHPVEPGRHPLHLFQQNSMRDALVASITFDTFHRHADKLYMANIAQLVNVLQALILTHEDRMALTPTYHVFDMYRPHMGGQSVRVGIESDDIPFDYAEAHSTLPGLSASASLKDRTLTLSVTNPHIDSPAEATIRLPDARFNELAVTELSHKYPQAHNTSEMPTAVRPRNSHLALGGREWQYTFPPASVTVFRAALS